MNINFDKLNGIIPVIIQHFETKDILMLGFMNEEAYIKTKESKKVTFFSRTKQKIWTKGETSGNFLLYKNSFLDCDKDTLLIFAEPLGPTCHTGNISCFFKNEELNYDFFFKLINIIKERKNKMPKNSYISSLFEKGIDKIAQKVGEEAVEVVIEAKNNDKEKFLNESADLIFHFLILLIQKGYEWSEIIKILKERHENK